MIAADESAKCLFKLLDRSPENELLAAEDRAHPRLNSRPHALGLAREIQQRHAHAVLLYHAEFRAPISGPGCLIVSRVRRHFLAEAYCLNAAAAYAS
jgi:hypothetical protein